MGKPEPVCDGVLVIVIDRVEDCVRVEVSDADCVPEEVRLAVRDGVRDCD